MNEAFAKILMYSIIFWIVLATLSTIFAGRMATYILQDQGKEEIMSNVSYDNISILTGIKILFDVMTFQLIEAVPIWISAVLDIIFLLTGISVVMGITNR